MRTTAQKLMCVLDMFPAEHREFTGVLCIAKTPMSILLMWSLIVAEKAQRVRRKLSPMLQNLMGRGRNANA